MGVCVCVRVCEAIRVSALDKYFESDYLSLSRLHRESECFG